MRFGLGAPPFPHSWSANRRVDRAHPRKKTAPRDRPSYDGPASGRVKNMKKIEREAVMEALRAQAPRAQHVAELCGHLNIPKSQKDEVLDALARR